MNEAIAKHVLEVFDKLNREVLDLSQIVERAGGPTPAERDDLRETLLEMLRQGWLRSAPGWDLYARTEGGRLAIAGPLDVTLYTRLGCHLCEEAKAQMASLIREFGAKLREVDVDADPKLREVYTNDVPVIFLGSRKVAKHRINPSQFRRQLERARREKTVR